IGVHLAPELFAPEARLVGPARGDAREVATDLLGCGEEREPLEGEEDLAPGLALHAREELEVLLERRRAHHERGRLLDPARVDVVHQYSITCQGRPRCASSSRKGFGSNSSMLWTPGFFQMPFSIIVAPTTAGTP